MIKLLLLLLLIPFTLKSQIKTNAYLEIGTTNWSKTMYYNNNNYINISSAPISFYSSMMHSTEWRKFKIQNLLKTFMDKTEEDHTFSPLYACYTISVEWNYKNLIIGVEHECTHPIINSPISDDSVKYRASHDRLYVRFNI